MAIAPIKPEEALSMHQTALEAQIPDTVFEVFNELIVSNFRNGRAVVKQDDVLAKLVESGLNRQEIFAKRWLDVESIYRRTGWKVSYDRPAYNENYPVTYTFEK